MRILPVLAGIAATAAAAYAATETTAAVTYTENVAPILFAQCAGCHRPGQSAPFSLLTYEDAVKHARLIATVTKSRYMPPWKALPASYPYRDARRLTDAQIATLDQWVKLGTPQGDLAKLPAAPKFNEGWQLGSPDLVVEMPAAIEIPASGPDVYRNVIIPLGLTEDKWVQAIEIRPSARRVVHHVLYFADQPESLKKINHETTEGSAGMPFTATTVPLGGWAAGAQPHLFPHGLALPLPKGNDLVFQYHFHPTGKAESEKTQIGLYFSKEPPARTLLGVQLPVLFGLFAGLKIPAGEKKFSVHDSFTLPADVEGVVVGAHSHYLGKTMKLTATLPDGEVKTLLDIKDWDFAWQDRYFFEQYVPLPKGTKLDGDISWDNSDGNPSHPPVDVRWGEQSFDEMGGVGMQFVALDEADVPQLRKAIQQHTRQMAGARLTQDPEFRTWFWERYGSMLRTGPGGNPFDGSNRAKPR
jgi:mono/diheme cytochrome c family protein